MICSHPLKSLTTLLLTTLLVLASNSYAQVYKTVDDSGAPVFSDQASDGEIIDIKTTNTVPTVQPSNHSPSNESSNEQRGYKTLLITSPANDSIITNGLAGFTASVSVSPALQSGHLLVLSIDGTTHSRGNSTQFTIDKINRGQHTIQASIIDQRGHTLISSPSNAFFVYWPGGR